MSAVWTSLIAVGGTLLGTLVTLLFQRLNADRAERHASARRLFEERLAAYGAFAGALVNYRRGQYYRVHHRLEKSDDAEYQEARGESYRLRSSAQQELFRVQLVTADPEIIRCATRALEFAEVIHDAGSKDKIRELGDRAKQAGHEFISKAGAELRAFGTS